MLEVIFFVVGILFLIKGADYLVEGSSSLAKKFGVPTLIIGLTIVAFGTSMPELIVNIISSFKGAAEIAFGNVIGSNLSNILLILGITALITKTKVQSSTVWKEIPFSLLAVFVLGVFANKFILNGLNVFELTRADGLILISFFAIFLYYVFELSKKKKYQLEDKKLQVKQRSSFKIVWLILIGLIGLYFGGKWTVEGAVNIASWLGMSQFLISATVVAIGTSLPELVTSVVAAMKKDVDLAVGNIIGSNIFNVFWVLGATSLIAPISIPSFINIDLLILLGASFLLFAFMFIGKKHELERWQGAMFIIFYILYLIFIILRG